MMVLLEARNKFIYEVRPSIFPEGELTATEMLMWQWYYDEKNSE